jgi:deoxyribodipyrimidine photo-lyase
MRNRLDLSRLDRDPRVTVLSNRSAVGTGACVLYWMQNAHRAEDNTALDLAIRLADALGVGVTTFFALDEQVPYASARTFSFMLQGLRETQVRLAVCGAPLVIRRGPSVAELLSLCAELRPAVVVTDFSPLRRGRDLRKQAASALSVPLVEVDTEHVVPLRQIGREHWAARTLRPVVERYLPAVLVEPSRCEPLIAGPVAPGLDLQSTDLDALVGTLSIDHTVRPVPDRPGGRDAGLARLRSFLETGLVGYREGRRARGSGSGLSPYLRFGQLAPLRVALATQAADVPPPDRAAFLEQLIVRRELAANFVLFNPNYGLLAGAPAWARTTLARHVDDPRPALYSPDQLRSAATADEAWNAAQRELLHLGRIEGYPRMYWGKKLIEWTADPADALAVGLELNDRYALDGRSPNGFTNLLWCFGRHDRPWPERPIFGIVRTMSQSGLRRKLDLAAYAARVERAINRNGGEV